MKLRKESKTLVCLILNDSSNDSENRKIGQSYKTKRIVTLIVQDLFHNFKQIKDRNSCITADDIYILSPQHVSDQSRKQKDQRNHKTQEDRSTHCATLK